MSLALLLHHLAAVGAHKELPLEHLDADDGEHEDEQDGDEHDVADGGNYD